MLQCGWLDVRQLVKYHSLVLLFKIRHEKKPTYFHEKISNDFKYKTRLVANHGIKHHNMLSTELTKSSFLNRTTEIWNKLPNDLKGTSNIKIFKKKVRLWTINYSENT